MEVSELHLRDCNLSSRSLIAIAAVVEANHGLRSLDLSANPQLVAGGSSSKQIDAAVRTSIAAHMSLTELRLAGTGFGDKHTRSLAIALLEAPSLTWLDLSDNSLGTTASLNGCVAALADLLSPDSHCPLGTLDLSYNGFSHPAAARLGSAIAANQRLEHLVNRPEVFDMHCEIPFY